MFRGENLPGVAGPRVRSALPFVCDFDVVEHVLNVPLWMVRVLPLPLVKPLPGPDERVWSRYFVDAADVLLRMVTMPGWEQCIVHVLLPAHPPQRSGPTLARCNAIWSAKEPGYKHNTWYFETDAGNFFDPLTTVDCSKARKRKLQWVDSKSDFVALGELAANASADGQEEAPNPGAIGP